MMIRFSFNRFGKLACWSLTNDKRYYVKCFLQVLVTLLLLFIMFTTMKSSGFQRNYQMCSLTVTAMFFFTLVMGPSFMFYGMDGKRDMQSLMMLPASNLEKYLMRYATWVLLLPIYFVAFLAADLLQYAIHWALGSDNNMLVFSVWTDIISRSWHEIFQRRMLAHSLLALVLWLHSLYALGATFFRSRKYSSVLTTVVLIVGFVLLSMIDEWFDASTPWWNYCGINNLPFLVLTVLNFWLSYQLFCRTQVIGKFINL